MLELASQDPSLDHRGGGDQGPVERLGEGRGEQVRSEVSCIVDVAEQKV